MNIDVIRQFALRSEGLDQSVDCYENTLARRQWVDSTRPGLRGLTFQVPACY